MARAALMDLYRNGRGTGKERLTTKEGQSIGLLQSAFAPGPEFLYEQLFAPVNFVQPDDHTGQVHAVIAGPASR